MEGKNKSPPVSQFPTKKIKIMHNTLQEDLAFQWSVLCIYSWLE